VIAPRQIAAAATIDNARVGMNGICMVLPVLRAWRRPSLVIVKITIGHELVIVKIIDGAGRATGHHSG
jgi:hypothetical protein